MFFLQMVATVRNGLQNLCTPRVAYCGLSCIALADALELAVGKSITFSRTNSWKRSCTISAFQILRERKSYVDSSERFRFPLCMRLRPLLRRRAT